MTVEGYAYVCSVLNKGYPIKWKSVKYTDLQMKMAMKEYKIIQRPLCLKKCVDF